MRRAGFAVCLAAALGWGCDGAPEKSGWDGPRPVSVQVTRIEPQVLVDTVALTGQLEAEYEVIMKPEVDGVVESIEFAEGQPVGKGDILFVLKDGVQRARVAEAQAELRLAERIFEREGKLARRDASSVAAIEEARAKLDVATARLDLAQINLSRTRIRAPFDGVPGARLVAPGTRIEEFTGMVSLAAIDRLQVIFTVTEQAIALARVGAPVHVRVAAWPGERFPGEVFFVSPTVDPAARRLVLKAWVPNSDGRLKPGMFTNVDVQIARREEALIVPEAAMVYDRNGTYVWRIVDEDQAEKVPVEIGLRREGSVEIVKGLRSGDAIVTAGTHKVMAGKKLKLVEPAETAHAADADRATAPPRGGES